MATPIPCPHCGGPTRIRKSEAVSNITREGVIECRNVECLWRGKYVFSMTHTLSPALAPDTSVRIPLSPQIAKRLNPEPDQ
ncbi:ogr/Delta-like zinc finger family protein [Salinisphaera sp. USBA-960]|nr:ogr/Delta-like zinc finger family protein [Salifodinibacter halophilus]NNC25280.1 ogr/Delta-like zinc finger family protein [Salifodinibacter halophilus]